MISAFLAAVGAAVLGYWTKYGVALFLRALPLLTLAVAGLLLYFVLGHAGLAWYLRAALSGLVVLLAGSAFCLGFEVRGDVAAASPVPAPAPAPPPARKS